MLKLIKLIQKGLIMRFLKQFNHSQVKNKTATPQETWQLNVFGRVQGVGFRWSVQVLADQMQLCGTVKNNSDQTVTIVLQASLALVNEFCAALPHNISQFAKISKIKKEKLVNVGKMQGFHVLY